VFAKQKKKSRAGRYYSYLHFGTVYVLYCVYAYCIVYIRTLLCIYVISTLLLAYFTILYIHTIIIVTYFRVGR
jgi:hypothetical protein